MHVCDVHVLQDHMLMSVKNDVMKQSCAVAMAVIVAY